MKFHWKFLCIWGLFVKIVVFPLSLCIIVDFYILGGGEFSFNGCYSWYIVSDCLNFWRKKKLVNANSLFSHQKMSSKFNASLDAIKSITSLNIDTNSLANMAAILNKSTWSQNILKVCKGMWNSVWLLVFLYSCYERHCSNKCSVVLLE